jgi:hypothetical protein
VRRRRSEDDHVATAVAHVAQETAWRAERDAVDQPLTLDEFRRYAALSAQRVDVEAAIRAVGAQVAPAVAHSRSEHGQAVYVRQSRGVWT